MVRQVVVMRRVTVRVPAEESIDLLERPARACCGFVENGRPRIEPVVLVFRDGRYLVGIRPGAKAPDPDTEAVLVVDDGVLFFELRAVYVRGLARTMNPQLSEQLRWIELEPSRVSSWNYGRMRLTREAD
jgi:hypothetical protein